MARCLVTGGAGFIGSHVADALIEKEHKVVVLDNLFTGDRKNVNPKAKFVKDSILSDLNDLFEEEKFDYVFHLAAQANLRKSLENPKMDAEINILGSLNVIENCVKYGVKKIVFSSTAALYDGDASVPCDENQPINPLSPYGLTKATVERYLEIMNTTRGLNYVVLRYSNVYGPRQDAKGEAGVVSIFIDSLGEGKDVTIFGDGEQTRDFVYVKDVASADVFAMEEKMKGVYHVSSGKEISINELAEKIQVLSGKDVKIAHGKEIKGELRRSCLANEKLKRRGWSQKYDLDSGLKETIKWFRASKG
jgi:UDP-glucose 4-epimerase